ncbi:MAG: hypothetical protein KDA44_08915 [Planctomycetales bacterium]|nr:hypothetical protein [Planctomycetales bacterium]
MHIEKHFRFPLLVLGAALVATIGCGGPYDAVVTGEVTLNGETLGSGSVAFLPADGGPTAYAEISSDGRYDVYTGKERGLSSGDYSVTVVSLEPPATERSQVGGPPAPGKALTPPWYAMAEYSRLKFQVDSGSNEINLELNTTPPEGWQPTRRRR